MTLVRRDALDRVGGWAEWCICEDAELGLRLFKAGYHSVYVNRSFGRGLIPDSFMEYRKQRFRWAYGAVQILKRHWKSPLPFGLGRMLDRKHGRSEEHTSELQSLMRISYAVFCLKKKTQAEPNN